MRAQLKGLHSPDAPDLATYVPDDPQAFGLLVQMLAGPADAEGEESFDVVVCTGRWLESKYRDRAPYPLRHHILVGEYDYGQLREGLRRLVEACGGARWDEVAAKLSRIGHWEFEDHVP